MFTRKFWIESAERAIKTGAQFALAALGVKVFTTIGEAMNAAQLIGLAFTFGGCLSVLTSLASLPFGDKDDPSIVKTGK